MITLDVSMFGSGDIGEDFERPLYCERDVLWGYLAISAKQLDDGDFSDVTAESIIAEGRARRANEVMKSVQKRDTGGAS